jgi:hypothetical protein
VVNRATLGNQTLSAQEAAAAAARLESAGSGHGDTGPGGTAPLTAGLLRLHAERMRRVAREQRLRRQFRASHPEVATVVVPALPSDVHDLDGLRKIGELLADRSG